MIWRGFDDSDLGQLLIVAGFTMILLISLVGVTAATPGNNSTSDTTETETQPIEKSCELGPNEPEMEQARLHASDKIVESGNPGQIAGGFQVDPTANCPVVVHITMSVPSGVTISGGSDFTSSGAGMVTSQFTVSPGANIKDIAANVYSTETGDQTVTADIQYWPKGHEDSSREIDGLSLTFNVEEETTPPDESDDQAADQASELAGGFTMVTVIGALVAIVAVAKTRRNNI